MNVVSAISEVGSDEQDVVSGSDVMRKIVGAVLLRHPCYELCKRSVNLGCVRAI